MNLNNGKLYEQHKLICLNYIQNIIYCYKVRKLLVSFNFLWHYKNVQCLVKCYIFVGLNNGMIRYSILKKFNPALITYEESRQRRWVVQRNAYNKSALTLTSYWSWVTVQFFFLPKNSRKKWVSMLNQWLSTAPSKFLFPH